jgi:hypothetical protein
MIETFDDLARTEESESIELVFPARADLVVLARFTAATIAARAGFDVEEIEDLRLAVDELCVSFGPMDDRACIRMELGRSDDTVTIVASFDQVPSPAAGGAAKTLDAVSWEQAIELSERLLDSLTDAHGRETRAGRPTAWLRKRHAAADR